MNLNTTEEVKIIWRWPDTHATLKYSMSLQTLQHTNVNIIFHEEMQCRCEGKHPTSRLHPEADPSSPEEVRKKKQFPHKTKRSRNTLVMTYLMTFQNRPHVLNFYEIHVLTLLLAAERACLSQKRIGFRKLRLWQKCKYEHLQLYNWANSPAEALKLLLRGPWSKLWC